MKSKSRLDRKKQTEETKNITTFDFQFLPCVHDVEQKREEVLNWH